MKILFASAAAAALQIAAPAHAQHAGHGAPEPVPADPHAGHAMPAAPEAPPADPHAGHAAPSAPATPPTMDHSAMDHSAMDHSAMGHGAPAEAPPAADHAAMGHAMPYAGALGFYPMAREASGTAWQPDASSHAGVHGMAGAWTTMAHAALNLTYDWQDGPRGDEMAFAAGMVMGSARRDLEGGGVVQVRAMLSPDPFMGKRGLPILLGSGETADGINPLVDRQHPHDLFMELAGSVSHRLSETDSLFLYAGLPGAPAFGPPAFMHRASIMDSPEPPITHHWLDSTHITFGVVTAGFVHRNWKVEASRFHGREPNEARFDIETGPLDSTAVRLSWNPTANWSLQASWADVKSPEQLEPDQDQTKWSASALYAAPFRETGQVAATAAWGRRAAHHGGWLDAWALEAALKPDDAWTIFARAERTETDELVHGPAQTVGKASIGAIHDWRLSEHVKLGVGGLYAVNFIPGALEASYGGDPSGGMVFLRVKVE